MARHITLPILSADPSDEVVDKLIGSIILREINYAIPKAWNLTRERILPSQ